MVAGILTGYIIRHSLPDEEAMESFSGNISVLTDIFLRLIKMIIAPLVFTTLVVGVARLGDVKAVGRIGGKAMLWFISATFLSLFIGLVLVNIWRPGDIMHLPLPDQHASAGVEKSSMTFRGFITHVFPSSVIEAMATNEILQIVVFSLFFGVATAAAGEKGGVIVRFLDAVADVMLK